MRILSRYFLVSYLTLFAVLLLASLLAIGVIVALQLYERRGAASRYVIAGLAIAMVLNFSIKNWRQQAVWTSNQSLWQYEAHRDEPSLLSIQELAKHWIHQAGAASDPDEVRALTSAARREIARGFEREASLVARNCRVE